MFHLMLHVAKEPWLFLGVQSILIVDNVTYRLNQPRGQCSENHLKQGQGNQCQTPGVKF